MARRFSLFRRSEAQEPAGAPAEPGEGNDAGFGFVTFGSEDAAGAEDINRPIIIGSPPNPPGAGGGTSIPMEDLVISNEGIETAGGRMEVYGVSHEVQSPPDAAAPGEKITIHGQYDMDTAVKPPAGPFAMNAGALEAPAATVSLPLGEVIPSEAESQLPGDVEGEHIDELGDVLG